MTGRMLISDLNIYQIPAAKALIGASLIQYLIYALIYIVEGFMLTSDDLSPSKLPTN